MSNREEFKKALQAKREEAKEQGDVGFEYKILSLIRGVWPVAKCESIDDFFYNYPNFPVNLVAYRDKAFDLSDFIKGVPKPLKEALVKRLVDSASPRPVGVIFRGSKGPWVIHSYWTLQPVAGSLRCLWPGKDGENGLVIERLQPFLGSLVSKWEPGERFG